MTISVYQCKLCDLNVSKLPYVKCKVTVIVAEFPSRKFYLRLTRAAYLRHSIFRPTDETTRNVSFLPNPSRFRPTKITSRMYKEKYAVRPKKVFPGVCPFQPIAGYHELFTKRNTFADKTLAVDFPAQQMPKNCIHYTRGQLTDFPVAPRRSPNWGHFLASKLNFPRVSWRPHLIKFGAGRDLATNTPKTPFVY